MNLKTFAKKWNVSRTKALQMCPYIEGARKCPCCNGWDIPDNAVAIYIPDKRNYKKSLKKYCYVMDAIENNMRIVESLSLISDSECQTIVSQLRQRGVVVLRQGCPDDSLDYKDYMIALSNKWGSETAANKTILMLEVLKTVQAAAYMIAAFNRT